MEPGPRPGSPPPTSEDAHSSTAQGAAPGESAQPPTDAPQTHASEPSATDSDPEVEDLVDRFVKSGGLKPKAIRAALQSQLAFAQEELFKEREAGAADMLGATSKMRRVMHDRRVALLEEAVRITKETLEKLDREVEGRHNRIVGIGGLIVAAVALVTTVYSLSMQKSQVDQGRGAAHADEPVVLSIKPLKAGDVAIWNLSRFTVRNVEVEHAILDYSTACDAVLGEAGSFVGSPGKGLFPGTYWDEMQPLEKRTLSAGDVAQYENMPNRRGCERLGEGSVYPLTEKPVARGFPFKTLLTATAIPACSSNSPCRRIVHVIVRARHPFTSEVRKFEEYMVGGADGNLVSSDFFHRRSSGVFVWTDESAREMFVRVAKWRAEMAGFEMNRDEVHERPFEGHGLWQATGVPIPEGVQP